MSRFPLRCTVLATAALLLIPAIALQRQPRPRAAGLGRLLPHASLLQSFPAAPERTPPLLWQQRLPDDLLQPLWQQQRQLWWQFWGHDGVGGAYLVMATPRAILSGAIAPPPHSLQLDGLLVVAANPVAEGLLRDQLGQTTAVQQGLQQRCLERLEQRQAAYWSAAGLGAMAGPITPLLQPFQEGCVALQLDGTALMLTGEAAATSGLLAAAGEPVRDADLPPPLEDSLLLQLRGLSLQPVLRGLLGRQLIRQPLVSAYGFSDSDLTLLQQSPFQLKLRPHDSGPYQAGLELVLAPQGDRDAWQQLLQGLGERLLDRGLDAEQDGAAEGSRWRDPDGRVVGGWRWLDAGQEQPLLQLYLGPPPPAFDPVTTGLASPADWRALPSLSLQARPAALAALNLLPPRLPLPLQQSQQLLLLAGAPEAEAGGPSGGPSRLLGRLELNPQPVAGPASAAPPQR